MYPLWLSGYLFFCGHKNLQDFGRHHIMKMHFVSTSVWLNMVEFGLEYPLIVLILELTFDIVRSISKYFQDKSEKLHFSVRNRKCSSCILKHS